MTIDLSKMSLIELKAFCYDQLAAQEHALANLRAANQVIAQRTEAANAEIDARFAAAEKKNAALDAKIAAQDARGAALEAKVNGPFGPQTDQGTTETDSGA